uniref:TonB-dependent receptor plug domain-containing protein n=1 Tax=Daejeonella sp. TaxID=2805397 RepID=UPI0037BF6DE0
MITKTTKLILTLILSIGIFSTQLFAQTTIRGTVKSGTTSQKIDGATVTVKGTKNATQTSNGGQFNITAKVGDQLLISFLGYETETITVENSTAELSVLLFEASNTLDDVVVVGYGTQSKLSLTSAVSQIKGADLVRRPVSNLQQALQGQAPGLTVLDRGGEPGRSSATLRVRGITTFSGNSSANSSPLIIIDGVEQTLFNINPEDVETISVLKDASSTAIYGSRAANGVILVTTKRGQSGKTQIAYNGFYAIQESTNNPENMDLEPFMRYQQLAYVNSGIPIVPRYTDASITTWINATDRERYPLPNTWFQTVLKAA